MRASPKSGKEQPVCKERSSEAFRKFVSFSLCFKFWCFGSSLFVRFRVIRVHVWQIWALLQVGSSNVAKLQVPEGLVPSSNSNRQNM